VLRVRLPYEPQIVEWCPDFIGSSISDSESDDIGSNPISITNVGFSLTGKVPHCECGEQGFPIAIGRVNRRNNEQGILNGE
jgi:hypothetical protein